MKKLNYYEPQKTEEDALLAAKQYVNANGPIEFDWMNCNEYLDDNEPECDGWDGEDRRCNCGKRRVSWDIEKNSNGMFYAVARAY